MAIHELPADGQQRFFRVFGVTMLIFAFLLTVGTVLILISLGMWRGDFWQAQGFATAGTAFFGAWAGGYALGRTRK